MTVSNPVRTRSVSKFMSATIQAGQALSDVVDMSELVGDAGMVLLPSSWTSASLGFYISATQDGTFAPLRDESGVVVQITGIQTAALTWYKLPEALRGARFVKFWSQTSGVSVNQSAMRSLTVSLKS